ncbi:MAG: hypothetical protein U0163_21575 [Gemmatimonadaceae bacterium]
MPKAVVRGVTAGALGGFLVFEGKRITGQVGAGHGLGYAYVARATASVGVSLMENAAAGRGLFSQAHMDVGFVRVDVSRTAAPIRFRLLPSSLISTAIFARRFNLNWSRTLETGGIVFDTRDGSDGSGETLANVIAVVDSPDHFETDPRLAHELVHSLQFEDFAALTYFFQPLATEWNASHRTLGRFLYPDFIEFGALRLRYDVIEGGRAEYCRNYLEQEANALGHRASACP